MEALGRTTWCGTVENAPIPLMMREQDGGSGRTSGRSRTATLWQNRTCERGTGDDPLTGSVHTVKDS